MDLNILKSYGIDPENGVKRCLGDQALYENILGLFMEDDTLPQARTMLQERDYEGLFSCMHTLKGASGNAGMTELFTEVNALVELLRPLYENAQAVNAMFSQVEAAYDKARQGIALAEEG